MPSRIFAVDVDQTLVNTAYEWWKWLELETKLGLPWETVRDEYDFSRLYKKELEERCLQPMAFWKQSRLYDNLEPIEDSERVLKWASRYFKINFVSAIVGDHGGSKHDFLKKHFPYMNAVIYTKEKGEVKHTIAIDDRNENLNSYDENAFKIFYNARHKQYHELTAKNVVKVSNWEQVETALIGYLERGNG